MFQTPAVAPYVPLTWGVCFIPALARKSPGAHSGASESLESPGPGRKRTGSVVMTWMVRRLCSPLQHPLPAVLVPGLDLRVREVERSCQVHAVLHTQVFLPLKATLQLIELVVRESCSGFARLFGSHRGTFSATRNLPVSFLLCSYGRNP